MNGLAEQLITHAFSEEPEDTGSAEMETVGKLSQWSHALWSPGGVCVSETLELRPRILTHAIKSLRSEPRNLPFSKAPEMIQCGVL